MRRTAFIPQLSDRQPRTRWEESGGAWIHQRAMQRVQEILSRENTFTLTSDVDTRILAEFEALKTLVKV